MKRWIALLFLLAGCSLSPSPPPSTSPGSPSVSTPEARTPPDRRDLFRAALMDYENGDRASAAAFFTSVARVYPELADYGLRYLAKIAEATNDATGAEQHWRALRDHFADSVWIGEADLAIGRAEAAADNWPAAASDLASARRRLKGPSDLIAALALSIEVARHLGSVEEARGLGSELRSRYPQSPAAAAVREQAWSERDTGALANADTAEAEVSLLIAEGDGERALELVRAAERRFPSADKLPKFLWLESSALAKTKDRDLTERLLERILAEHPRTPEAAQALFRLGSLAWNRDDDGEASRRFTSYAGRYPDGAKAAEALYALARIRQEARRFDLASAAFARLARSYPKSSLAGEARFRVGWCLYLSGNRTRAARSFEELAGRGSGEEAAALYWRARSAHDNAPYEQILRDHPESYYATLAERRLGREPASSLVGRVTLESGSEAAPATCSVGDSHLTRFQELQAMSLAALARGELAAVSERSSGCDAFWISSWALVEGYRQSVARAQRSGGCGLDSPWLRFCYPLGFWPLIERQTSARALDPYVVAALIRQESLFDAEARSSANALGLMQLLPATAERIAAETAAGGVSANALFDPAQNVALGTAYLRKLLDRYDGNLPRALAAYNAGEAAVDKWQRRYPDVEDDEFVESISYRETRAYVKRVLANQRMYQALYRARSGSPPS